MRGFQPAQVGPELVHVAQPDQRERIYVHLVYLAYMVQHVRPESSWTQRVTRLIDVFPSAPKVGITDMGFPADWRRQELWRAAE